MLLRNFDKFIRMTLWEKLLIAEAFVLSGVMYFGILLIPFRKLLAFIGENSKQALLPEGEKERQIIKKVTWAVSLTNDHTPWKSKCLVRALTACIMLRRRGIGSIIYLGVARDKSSKLIAHAWLKCGMEIITGGFESRFFTVVAQFPGKVEVEKP